MCRCASGRLRPAGRVGVAAWLAIAAGVGCAAGDTTPVVSLAWSTLPPLPAPRSGQIAGLVGDRLVVLGGTDFPVGLFQGGPKIWFDDVYVLERGAASWRVARGVLPGPLAYAAVASTAADGLVVVGGSDADKHHAHAFRVVQQAGELVRRPLPSLPVPTALGGAAILGRVLYVVGGQQSPADAPASRDVWALDLDHLANGWTPVEPLPGAGRILPVVVAQAGALYVSSGAALAEDVAGEIRRTYLTDTLRYVPAAGWREVTPAPHPVVAASAVPVGQGHVFVFGGDDGTLVDRVWELRDAHPGFRREVLAYHTFTDTWTTVGDMPAGPVTAAAVRDGPAIVVPGGETRPGHRTAEVLRVSVGVGARGFAALDWVVLGGYLAALLWIGRHFSRGNVTRDDYFLGGRRVPWWAAGLSIYGTQLSAITFLAIPAKAYAEDWTFLPGNLSIVLVAPVVVAWYLPHMRRQPVTSAYEYLERRFNLATRLVGSVAFILLQGARMAIVLFLPALALAAVTGIDVYLSILCMGVLCTAYTLQGGMRAVIWADVLQVIVLLAAVGVSLTLIAWHVDGGVTGIARAGYDAGKLRTVDWSLDLTVASIWVVLGGSLLSHLVPYTADQAVVQRYLTTRDEAQAARAVWTGAALAVPTSILFFTVGTALWAFYRANPALLNPVAPVDSTFPWFIAQQLPAGVSGLVVSGVFAAAMSTLSSSINSITTAVVTDFSVRLHLTTTEANHMRLARWLTVVVGTAGTASALLLASWDVRSLWDTFLQALGLFGGGLAGMFALGVFTRSATGRGALVGFAVSAIVLLAVQQTTPVHFLLYGGIGIVTAFAVGYVTSLLVR
jgi:solute:Na+ symporter, SSS family